MKHAGRLLAVKTQRREERRLVAILEPAQNAEVQLAIVFLAVEHAMEALAQLARDVLGGNVRHHVEIELGAQLRDARAEQASAFAFGKALHPLFLVAVEQLAENVELVARAQRKAVADHARLQVEVEEDSDQRVLEARHDDDLVDELVIVAAHAVQALAQRIFLLRR